MKKIMIGILLLIAVACVVGIGLRHQRALSVSSGGKPVVKIGVLLPLSGNMAHLGNTVKGAIEVAGQDANAQNNRYFYQFLFEDNLLEPMRSAIVLKKLIFVDKVDAVLSFSSSVGHVIAPVAEENKVPHISMSSDETMAGGQYNFINWTMPGSETDKMTEIIQKKGYRSVALVVLNHQGALAVSGSLTPKLDAVGIKNKILTINPGIRDFRMAIAKLKHQMNPDLYVMLLFEPEAGIFIKQLRESGAKTDVTSIELFSFLSHLSLIEGAWYVDAAGANNETMERIKAHNKSDATYALGTSYDNVMMLVKAFETAPTKDKAVDVLSGIATYDGVSGRLTRKGNVFDSEAVVKHIKDGKITIGE